MNETILAQVRKSEYKYNYNYAKKDGSLYTGLRTVFIIAFVFAAVFALFVALQPWVNDGVKYESASAVPMIYTFLISGVLAVVFSLFRISVATVVLSVPTGIAVLLEFAKLLPDPNVFLGINVKFYWAHLAPILTLVFCAVFMLVIELRANRILKQNYTKIANRIYEEYSSHAENLSEEEWEEFLKNYDPRPSKKTKR